MRIASLITAFMLFFTLFSPCAFADSAIGFNERDSEGMPIVSCDTVLKQAEWDGKARLKSGICYFVDSSVVVTANNTLPENSMIVIENKGKLTVNENVKLYVKGAVIVHSKATLAIYGRVFLKSTSTSVINGKLLIGDEGRISVYGNLQVSEGGVMGVKGRIAVHKNGAVLNYGTIKKMSSSAVVSDAAKKIQGEIPLYVVKEYSDYINYDITMFYGIRDDDGLPIEDKATKLKLIRSFESVLYKYDGEFKDVSVFVLNPLFYLRIAIDDNIRNDIVAGMNSWNCIWYSEWDPDGFETAKGRFYSSVMGIVDRNLFAEVDPESPLYIFSADAE